jgi:hypothetical protein
MIAAWFRQHPRGGLLAALMLVAFVTRAWQFGNPIIQIDEQFYLLTGDRMLHGAVPFVDIWDRKPIGIFLVYAAIRLLGGDGIVQYQIVATLFAGATAFVIGLMALRFANLRGALFAGIAYLGWLLVFDGSGGQTPVFYNLPMAAAAAIVLAATAPGVSRGRLIGGGLAAMLLVGIALQLKYSAVFEGLFFGLALLWSAWRTRGATVAIAAGAAWAFTALVPTIAAYAWYVRIGEADAFVYANFLSIFDRGHWPAAKLAGRLGTIAGLSLPLLLCAWVEWRSRGVTGEDPQSAHARRFALAWLGSAIAGLIVFGTYFTHYFLAVLPPLALACARLLGDRHAAVATIADGRERRMSIAAFVALTGIVLIAMTVPKRFKSRGDGHEVRAVAAVIRDNLHGCLFVFDGEPILYHLTNACLVTSRIFPNHLNDTIEAQAIGIDPAAEVRRVLAAGKADIIVGSDRPDPKYNAETLRLMKAGLARDYRPIFRITIGSRDRIVYQRRTDAGRAATPPRP